MFDLMTTGLTHALISADMSTRAASHPMSLVSREMKKDDPNLELVGRAGTYGNAQLNKAGKSLSEAQEELERSQKIAAEEKKAEDKKNLEEKANEKQAEKAAEASHASEASSAKESLSKPAEQDSYAPRVDTVEIDPELLANIPQTKVVFDVPKIYTPSAQTVKMDAIRAQLDTTV